MIDHLKFRCEECGNLVYARELKNNVCPDCIYGAINEDTLETEE